MWDVTTLRRVELFAIMLTLETIIYPLWAQFGNKIFGRLELLAHLALLDTQDVITVFVPQQHLLQLLLPQQLPLLLVVLQIPQANQLMEVLVLVEQVLLLVLIVHKHVTLVTH
jgi:hypothetical protein